MPSRRTGALAMALVSSVWLLAWNVAHERLMTASAFSVLWLLIGLTFGAAAVRLAWLRPQGAASNS